MPRTKKSKAGINKPVKAKKGNLRLPPKIKKKSVKRNVTFWDCVFLIFYFLLILGLIFGVYAYFSLLRHSQ
jgi:cell division septal protein FtsQ